MKVFAVSVQCVPTCHVINCAVKAPHVINRTSPSSHVHGKNTKELSTSSNFHISPTITAPSSVAWPRQNFLTAICCAQNRMSVWPCGWTFLMINWVVLIQYRSAMDRRMMESLTLASVNWFRKFFHQETAEEACCVRVQNSISPGMCCYTTIWKLKDTKC